VGNPVIAGTGRTRSSTPTNVSWEPWSLFLDDPDHLRINSEGVSHLLIRASPPIPNDLPCDTHNSAHVSRYYAWMRGGVAWREKGLAAARCWLGLSADQGYAPGQSALAGLLLQGNDGAAPDYAKAFDLAAKSAQQGDITGQLELANLFREGKGTAPDPVKAKYWLDQAARSRDSDLWRRLNAKDAGGMSVIEFGKIVANTMSAMISLAVPDSDFTPCNRQTNNCAGAPLGPNPWAVPTVLP
jgi:hypothetical protein